MTDKSRQRWMYIDPSRKQSALIESSNSGQQRDVMRSKAPGIRNALRVDSCQYAGLDAVDSSLKNVTAAHTGQRQGLSPPSYAWGKSEQQQQQQQQQPQPYALPRDHLARTVSGSGGHSIFNPSTGNTTSQINTSFTNAMLRSDSSLGNSSIVHSESNHHYNNRFDGDRNNLQFNLDTGKKDIINRSSSSSQISPRLMNDGVVKRDNERTASSQFNAVITTTDRSPVGISRNEVSHRDYNKDRSPVGISRTEVSHRDYNKDRSPVGISRTEVSNRDNNKQASYSPRGTLNQISNSEMGSHSMPYNNSKSPYDILTPVKRDNERTSSSQFNTVITTKDRSPVGISRTEVSPRDYNKDRSPVGISRTEVSHRDYNKDRSPVGISRTEISHRDDKKQASYSPRGTLDQKINFNSEMGSHSIPYNNTKCPSDIVTPVIQTEQQSSFFDNNNRIQKQCEIKTKLPSSVSDQALNFYSSSSHYYSSQNGKLFKDGGLFMDRGDNNKHQYQRSGDKTATNSAGYRNSGDTIIHNRFVFDENEDALLQRREEEATSASRLFGQNIFTVCMDTDEKEESLTTDKTDTKISDSCGITNSSNVGDSKMVKEYNRTVTGKRDKDKDMGSDDDSSNSSEYVEYFIRCNGTVIKQKKRNSASLKSSPQDFKNEDHSSFQSLNEQVIGSNKKQATDYDIDNISLTSSPPILVTSPNSKNSKSRKLKSLFRSSSRAKEKGNLNRHISWGTVNEHFDDYPKPPKIRTLEQNQPFAERVFNKGASYAGPPKKSMSLNLTPGYYSEQELADMFNEGGRDSPSSIGSASSLLQQGSVTSSQDASSASDSTLSVGDQNDACFTSSSLSQLPSSAPPPLTSHHLTYSDNREVQSELNLVDIDSRAGNRYYPGYSSHQFGNKQQQFPSQNRQPYVNVMYQPNQRDTQSEQNLPNFFSQQQQQGSNLIGFNRLQHQPAQRTNYETNQRDVKSDLNLVDYNQQHMNNYQQFHNRNNPHHNSNVVTSNTVDSYGAGNRKTNSTPSQRDTKSELDLAEIMSTFSDILDISSLSSTPSPITREKPTVNHSHNSTQGSRGNKWNEETTNTSGVISRGMKSAASFGCQKELQDRIKYNNFPSHFQTQSMELFPKGSNPTDPFSEDFESSLNDLFQGSNLSRTDSTDTLTGDSIAELELQSDELRKSISVLEDLNHSFSNDNMELDNSGSQSTGCVYDTVNITNNQSINVKASTQDRVLSTNQPHSKSQSCYDLLFSTSGKHRLQDKPSSGKNILEDKPTGRIDTDVGSEKGSDLRSGELRNYNGLRSFNEQQLKHSMSEDFVASLQYGNTSAKRASNQFNNNNEKDDDNMSSNSTSFDKSSESINSILSLDDILKELDPSFAGDNMDTVIRRKDRHDATSVRVNGNETDTSSVIINGNKTEPTYSIITSIKTPDVKSDHSNVHMSPTHNKTVTEHQRYISHTNIPNPTLLNNNNKCVDGILQVNHIAEMGGRTSKSVKEPSSEITVKESELSQNKCGHSQIQVTQVKMQGNYGGDRAGVRFVMNENGVKDSIASGHLMSDSVGGEISPLKDMNKRETDQSDYDYLDFKRSNNDSEMIGKPLEGKQQQIEQSEQQNTRKVLDNGVDNSHIGGDVHGQGYSVGCKLGNGVLSNGDIIMGKNTVNVSEMPHDTKLSVTESKVFPASMNTSKSPDVNRPDMYGVKTKWYSQQQHVNMDYVDSNTGTGSKLGGNTSSIKANGDVVHDTSDEGDYDEISIPPSPLSSTVLGGFSPNQNNNPWKDFGKKPPLYVSASSPDAFSNMSTTRFRGGSTSTSSPSSAASSSVHSGEILSSNEQMELEMLLKSLGCDEPLTFNAADLNVNFNNNCSASSSGYYNSNCNNNNNSSFSGSGSLSSSSHVISTVTQFVITRQNVSSSYCGAGELKVKDSDVKNDLCVGIERGLCNKDQRITTQNEKVNDRHCELDKSSTAVKSQLNDTDRIHTSTVKYDTGEKSNIKIKSPISAEIELNIDKNRGKEKKSMTDDWEKKSADGCIDIVDGGNTSSLELSDISHISHVSLPGVMQDCDDSYSSGGAKAVTQPHDYRHKVNNYFNTSSHSVKVLKGEDGNCVCNNSDEDIKDKDFNDLNQSKGSYLELLLNEDKKDRDQNSVSKEVIERSSNLNVSTLNNKQSKLNVNICSSGNHKPSSCNGNYGNNSSNVINTTTVTIKKTVTLINNNSGAENNKSNNNSLSTLKINPDVNNYQQQDGGNVKQIENHHQWDSLKQEGELRKKYDLEDNYGLDGNVVTAGRVEVNRRKCLIGGKSVIDNAPARSTNPVIDEVNSNTLTQEAVVIKQTEVNNHKKDSVSLFTSQSVCNDSGIDIQTADDCSGTVLLSSEDNYDDWSGNGCNKVVIGSNNHSGDTTACCELLKSGNKYCAVVAGGGNYNCDNSNSDIKRFGGNLSEVKRNCYSKECNLKTNNRNCDNDIKDSERLLHDNGNVLNNPGEESINNNCDSFSECSFSENKDLKAYNPGEGIIITSSQISRKNTDDNCESIVNTVKSNSSAGKANKTNGHGLSPCGELTKGLSLQDNVHSICLNEKTNSNIARVGELNSKDHKMESREDEGNMLVYDNLDNVMNRSSSYDDRSQDGIYDNSNVGIESGGNMIRYRNKREGQRIYDANQNVQPSSGGGLTTVSSSQARSNPRNVPMFQRKKHTVNTLNTHDLDVIMEDLTAFINQPISSARYNNLYNSTSHRMRSNSISVGADRPRGGVMGYSRNRSNSLPDASADGIYSVISDNPPLNQTERLIDDRRRKMQKSYTVIGISNNRPGDLKQEYNNNNEGIYEGVNVENLVHNRSDDAKKPVGLDELIYKLRNIEPTKPNYTPESRTYKQNKTNDKTVFSNTSGYSHYDDITAGRSVTTQGSDKYFAKADISESLSVPINLARYSDNRSNLNIQRDGMSEMKSSVAVGGQWVNNNRSESVDYRSAELISSAPLSPLYDDACSLLMSDEKHSHSDNRQMTGYTSDTSPSSQFRPKSNVYAEIGEGSRRSSVDNQKSIYEKDYLVVTKGGNRTVINRGIDNNDDIGSYRGSNHRLDTKQVVHGNRGDVTTAPSIGWSGTKRLGGEETINLDVSSLNNTLRSALTNSNTNINNPYNLNNIIPPKSEKQYDGFTNYVRIESNKRSTNSMCGKKLEELCCNDDVRNGLNNSSKSIVQSTNNGYKSEKVVTFDVGNYVEKGNNSGGCPKVELQSGMKGLESENRKKDNMGQYSSVSSTKNCDKKHINIDNTRDSKHTKNDNMTVSKKACDKKNRKRKLAGVCCVGPSEERRVGAGKS